MAEAQGHRSLLTPLERQAGFERTTELAALRRVAERLDTMSDQLDQVFALLETQTRALLLLGQTLERVLVPTEQGRRTEGGT